MKIIENYINSIINKTDTSMSGQDKTCYPQKNTVILKSKYPSENFKQSLKQNRSFINHVRRVDNINIPKIIFYTSFASGDYQLQSRAKGKPVGVWQAESFLNYLKSTSPDEYINLKKETEEYLKLSDIEDLINVSFKNPLDNAQTQHNNNSLKEILNCDDKHLTKALNDFYTLIFKYGCSIDTHSENLYFDKRNGFSFIDIEGNDRSLDVSDTISRCFKSFVNNYFETSPYENLETRFLRGLIAKKSFYCFQNSEYCNSENIKEIEDFDNFDLTIPTDREYDHLRILSTHDPSELKYKESELYLKSIYGPEFNIDEIDVDFILDYLDNHKEYDYKFNPEIKPTYETYDTDDLLDLNTYENETDSQSSI